MSLKFYYGVIGCGKTKDLIKIHNNYTTKQLNPRVVYFESTDGQRQRIYNIVTGESCPVISCKTIDNTVINKLGPLGKLDIVLVDNAHLVDESSAEILREIANLKIPVMAYGLRTRYNGSLYSGAAEMFRLADNVDEVKDVCWCGKKAIMSGAYDLQSYNPIRKLQDESKAGYIGVCSEHWMHGKYFKGNLGNNYRKRDVLINALNEQWSKQKLVYEFGDNFLAQLLETIDNADELLNSDKTFIEDGIENYDFDNMEDLEE